MRKRKKFLTALFSVILSLATVLCFAFAGCAEYKPPEGENPVNPPVTDPDDPITPPVNEKDFSVQLVVKNGNAWQNFDRGYYEASDGMGGVHDTNWVKWENIKVQWTNLETNQRHLMPLNEDGKAVCPGLDGDYKVTIPTLPYGFTYEPNENYVDNITKKIEIQVYKVLKSNETLRQIKLGNDNVYFKNVEVYKTTGAFKVTLKNKDDRQMCAFVPSKQGTYSLRTLVDVTQNKINPLLSVYTGQLTGGFVYHFQDKDDGGAENTYTKNIFWEYEISADEARGNAFFFELYSTSLDGNESYPLDVYFVMQRDGDFTRPGYVTTPVPVTEDFTKTPEVPSGNRQFTWAVYNPATEGKLLDMDKVILNTEKGTVNKTVLMGEQAKPNDGYYYFYTYDEADDTYTLTDRLYAGLGINNEVMEFTDPRVNFRFVEGKNYLDFVNTYRLHCTDGCYPVNEEIATFLQDFAISQRIFNDGYGLAEYNNGYNSDEESMWMFACGYYKLIG